VGGELTGLDRYEARERVLEGLEARGLLRGSRPHAMRISVCSRSGDVIEPLLVPQWCGFVLLISGVAVVAVTVTEAEGIAVSAVAVSVVVCSYCELLYRA
jgi:valyl-tRNA synthetase